MTYDIIGDVHGCINELHALFHKLGYEQKQDIYVHPDGRTPVFLGDITDRGPHSIKAINLVYQMVEKYQAALYVPGNHCDKLYRYFLGNNVQQRHGLETTVTEILALPESEQIAIRQRFMALYDQAPLYLDLPEVSAVVAHAGLKEEYIGRHDKRVRTFVLYGDVSGETDQDGRPIRRDWAQNYRGEKWIVYGHTPVKEPRRIHKTINIDTGCVFGNALTAFRLPEEKTMSVPSDQPCSEDRFRHFD